MVFHAIKMFDNSVNADDTAASAPRTLHRNAPDVNCALHGMHRFFSIQRMLHLRPERNIGEVADQKHAS